MTNENNLEVEKAELSSIEPCPWNPNEMTEDTFDHLVREIERAGYVDPILVRPHPGAEGKYQIIDGEHRYRALLEQGYSEADVIVAKDVDDEEARLLTHNLNNIKGTHDPVGTAELLAELREYDDDDFLMDALNMGENEFESYEILLDVPDYDEDELMDDGGGGEDGLDAELGEGAEPTEVMFVLDGEEREQVEQLVGDPETTDSSFSKMVKSWLLLEQHLQNHGVETETPNGGEED